MKTPISQSELKSILSYDPSTGIFRWLKRISIRASVGRIAGTNNGNGYVRMSMYGVRYHAHRLAFLYMTGSLPLEDVDHVDGDRSNNRWSNLRSVSHRDNCKNQRPRAKAIQAPIGVHWDRSRSKWMASIKSGRGSKHLGRFDDLSDAMEARRVAEQKYSFHENHGKPACEQTAIASKS